METPSATPQPPGHDWVDVAASIAWPAGWSVEAVAETGSTNVDLLAAARAGAPDRSVRTTAHQTAGRGRLDRRWDAPPGANLLVSILLRDVPASFHEATQRVALAGAIAAQRSAGVEARLKWPNDLLVDGAKLAGVLAQAGTTAGRVDHVVVGIGMNVGWAPPGAARLGDGVHPLAVLRDLLVAYDELPLDVHERYRRELVTIGQRVRVELPAGVLEGRAVDVERDGRLVVLDECGLTTRIDTGDVVHLRPA
jgi:BirA family transcriptional regulator, biotin operon repressor / biotin---[acetyl-CoA-carboxylase] ligase